MSSLVIAAQGVDLVHVDDPKPDPVKMLKCVSAKSKKSIKKKSIVSFVDIFYAISVTYHTIKSIKV